MSARFSWCQPISAIVSSNSVALEAVLLSESKDEEVKGRQASLDGPRERWSFLPSWFHLSPLSVFNTLLLWGKFTCAPISPAVPLCPFPQGSEGLTDSRRPWARQAWGRMRNEEGQMRQTGEAQKQRRERWHCCHPNVPWCRDAALSAASSTPSHGDPPDQHGVTASSLMSASLTHTCQNSRLGQHWVWIRNTDESIV